MKILSCTFNFLSKFKTNSIISSCENLQHFRFKSVLWQKTYSTCIISVYRYLTVRNDTPRTENSFWKKGKFFQETENEYAHEVMKKLPKYSNSLLTNPLQDDILKSFFAENLNAIENFAKITVDNIGKGTNLGNLEFKIVIQNVCCSLSQATDEEIKMALRCLCMWPPGDNTLEANFVDLWNKLDRECVKRFKRWDIDQQLLIADYWFYLRLSRISNYNREVIFNLIHNIDSLSNHQVVQLMFYINLQRKLPASFLLNIENKLQSVINCVTLEEVGIICLGFFKTENKILNSNLIECIVKKFMYNMENVNTITIAAILKFLRKSINRTLIDLYILTLHKCVRCVNSWDIPTSVHLALLSSECNVYHPLLLNCVSEKVACEIANARIKDCTKLLLCLSMYNHFEEKFFNLFLNELQKNERQNEFHMHPDHVVQAAIYFAYMGHFNYELLAKIFDRKFFHKTCSIFPGTCSCFAELDYCVEIECQDYTGPKLDVSVRKVLKNHRGNLPSKSEKQSMQARLLSEAYECLVEILGSDKNITIRHILPHMYSPDIIVRLTTLENKSLTDLYCDYPSNQVLKPPSNEVWACFVTGGFYSFAYKSMQMTGVTSMKLRQLNKLGYKVVFIPYYNMSKSNTKRKILFEEKLNELHRDIKKQPNISSV